MEGKTAFLVNTTMTKTIKPIRPFTVDEEREYRDEKKRQRTLEYGWHPIKDLHINHKGEMERRWYAVLFKKPGEFEEKTTMSAGEGKDLLDKSKVIKLCRTLNFLCVTQVFG